MARNRDTRRRGGDDDEELDDDDEPMPSTDDETDDDKNQDDEKDDDEEEEDDMPPSPRDRGRRGRRDGGDMQKAVTTRRTTTRDSQSRSRLTRCDRLIKALEEHTDIDLPRTWRAAIEEVFPDFLDSAIEKAVSSEPSRSEVKVSDLVADIGAEFSEALLPVLERLKRSEARTEEVEKALMSTTEALEDLVASNEKLQKSLDSLPEQDKLLKALVEQKEVDSRTTPERHRTTDPMVIAENAPLEKSTVGKIGTEQAREALADTEAVAFEKALNRADSLRAEHAIDVPGYSRAIGARGAGRVTREIAEELSKGVESVELQLKSSRFQKA